MVIPNQVLKDREEVTNWAKQDILGTEFHVEFIRLYDWNACWKGGDESKATLRYLDLTLSGEGESMKGFKGYDQNFFGLVYKAALY